MAFRLIPLILVVLLGACDSGQDPQAGRKGRAPPVSYQGYRQIGHEADALKGAAFAPGKPDPGLRPAAWQRQPITYPAVVKDADLVVTLDQQIYEQLAPRIQDFAQAKGVDIALNKGTCGASIHRLDNKQVDMGGFCCPPGPADRLPGLSYHTLGIAALAVLVHPHNPVDQVSSAQVRAIFNGRIRRWSELDKDAAAGAIIPVGRLHCQTRPGHWKLIAADEQTVSPNAKIVGGIKSMIDQVSQFPPTIGYETLWMVSREKKAVKILKVDGLDPGDHEALARGFYPFYRTYNLAIWEQKDLAKPLAGQLLAYLYEVTTKEAAHLDMVPASTLRKHGWQFSGDELVGEPGTDP